MSSVSFLAVCALSLALHLWGAGAASFTPTTSCTALSGCRISCSGATFDLTNVITSDEGNTQRYFTEATNQYEYGMVVPLCGSPPDLTAYYDWTTKPSLDYYQIWQFVMPTSSNPSYVDYYVGSYSGSWALGSYYGTQAFAAYFYSGQACTPTLRRSATVFLACSTEYTIDSPYITVNEVSTCVYEILIAAKELCILSNAPTTRPTLRPTRAPSSAHPTAPTLAPSCRPTVLPTLAPSARPSVVPTLGPTAPTRAPTVLPTRRPSQEPSVRPTAPTQAPSFARTALPSIRPTVVPSAAPSFRPTAPTVEPTLSPTQLPTLVPTTRAPTNTPDPSASPTYLPTREPTTAAPTALPSLMRQITSDSIPCNVTADSCIITCTDFNRSRSYDLTNGLIQSTSTMVQRYFNLAVGVKQYAALVPLCGSRPTAFTGTLAKADVWNVVSGNYLRLGSYVNTSWVMSSYGGAQAFGVNFTSGSICTQNGVNSNYQTTMYLICNEARTGNPLMSVLQETSCSYGISLQSSAFCLSPVHRNLTAEVVHRNTESPVLHYVRWLGPIWLSVIVVGILMCCCCSYAAFKRRKHSMYRVFTDTPYSRSMLPTFKLPTLPRVALPALPPRLARRLQNWRERIAERRVDLTALEPVLAEAYIQPEVVIDVPTTHILVIPATPRQEAVMEITGARDDEGTASPLKKKKIKPKPAGSSVGSDVESAGDRRRPSSRESAISEMSRARSNSGGSSSVGSTRANTPFVSPTGSSKSHKQPKRPIKVPPRLPEFNVLNERTTGREFIV